MVDKIDLVMWTKNGEPFLPRVLKRIDEVIPRENVFNKILVDDHSIDQTVKIAKNFNWNVYSNPKSGIPSGANEALSHVKSEHFVSVEQDILLAKNWWDKIPKYMENEKIACAQGIRLPTNPTLRKLEEYANARREQFFLVSIDNNIFKTKVVRQLGGFPTECPTCTDTILMKKITLETPYKWVIDKSVVSDHLKEIMKFSVEHGYKLSLMCAHTPYCSWTDISLPSLLKLFFTSPFRATIVAVKKRCPALVWYYPFDRFLTLKAFLDKRKVTVKRQR